MVHWKTNKDWSDQFLPEIKSILGVHLIGEPPIEEDMERNTDLMVLRLDAVRIGCRVRRVIGENGINYLKKYGDEFTFRAGLPNGYKTELSKIIEGWGDYFFYGFGDDGGLRKYTLANLNVFRLWYNKQLYKHKRPGQKNDNHDGSSYFLAFKWEELPENFIITSGEKSIDI